MAENKLRQNSSRTQDREWDDATSRTRNESMRPQNSDYDQDDNEPYLKNTGRMNRQRDYSLENRGGYNPDNQFESQDFRNDWYDQNRNTNFNTRGSSYGSGRGYGQSYEGGYQMNTGYGGSQYGGRNYERGSQGSYGNSYDQGNYDQGRYGNYPQQSGRYGQNESFRNGMSREQYGTPESSPWNQGNYPGNQELRGQYGQQFGQQYGQQYGQREGSNRGMGSYNTNTGSSRSESSLGINEQGSLYGSGPHKGKGPRGYQRSEERIKEDINDRLSDDGQLDASDIEVEVKDNSVILSGSVNSREAKRRAEDLAESISGVHNVENRLHVNRENENDRRSGSSTSNNQDQSQRNKKGSLTGATS